MRLLKQAESQQKQFEGSSKQPTYWEEGRFSHRSDGIPSQVTVR